jgi:signal transduction histidine kinase
MVSNTGLGLTMVKGVVDSHRGTIKIESILSSTRVVIILPKE